MKVKKDRIKTCHEIFIYDSRSFKNMTNTSHSQHVSCMFL